MDLGNESIRPVISIEGRRGEYIVLGDGRKIAGCDHIFINIEQISEAKIFQQTPGQIRIEVVKRPNYSQHDEEQLRKATRFHLGPDMILDIKYVNTIERAPSGKAQLIESTLAK